MGNKKTARTPYTWKRGKIPGATPVLPVSERSRRARVRGMFAWRGSFKTVVSKHSGMRWTPDGLASILVLHTSTLKRSFDQRWDVYRESA